MWECENLRMWECENIIHYVTLRYGTLQTRCDNARLWSATRVSAFSRNLLEKSKNTQRFLQETPWEVWYKPSRLAKTNQGFSRKFLQNTQVDTWSLMALLKKIPGECARCVAITPASDPLPGSQRSQGISLRIRNTRSMLNALRLALCMDLKSLRGVYTV